MRELVVDAQFDSGEQSAIVELTQAMHASVNDFMEMDFASYLRLGELELGGLGQLCNDPDDEEVPSKYDPTKAGTSFDSLGK